jgi:hypothetical protein
MGEAVTMELLVSVRKNVWASGLPKLTSGVDRVSAMKVRQLTLNTATSFSQLAAWESGAMELQKVVIYFSYSLTPGWQRQRCGGAECLLTPLLFNKYRLEMEQMVG